MALQGLHGESCGFGPGRLSAPAGAPRRAVPASQESASTRRSIRLYRVWQSSPLVVLSFPVACDEPSGVCDGSREFGANVTMFDVRARR